MTACYLEHGFLDHLDNHAPIRFSGELQVAGAGGNGGAAQYDGQPLDAGDEPENLLKARLPGILDEQHGIDVEERQKRGGDRAARAVANDYVPVLAIRRAPTSPRHARTAGPLTRRLANRGDRARQWSARCYRCNQIRWPTCILVQSEPEVAGFFSAPSCVSPSCAQAKIIIGAGPEAEQVPRGTLHRQCVPACDQRSDTISICHFSLEGAVSR